MNRRVGLVVVIVIVALMGTFGIYGKSILEKFAPKSQVKMYDLAFVEPREDIMKPEVDTDKHSMVLFAYNKASPECCATDKAAGYSTSKGCICLTDFQKKNFSGVKY